MGDLGVSAVKGAWLSGCGCVNRVMQYFINSICSVFVYSVESAILEHLGIVEFG